MGRCNNRRAQERAAQERNVPSRARFSKGPPKKNGRGGGKGGRGRGGGRGDGGRDNNNNNGRGRGGRGSGGGRGGRGGGRTSTNDAVVQKIQSRVARQSLQDIGGISIVSTRKRKANPLAGVDISKLDIVKLSDESVAVVERLLKEYNVWEQTNDNDDGNDSIEEKKDDNDDGDNDNDAVMENTSQNNLTSDAIPVLEDDLYDDYCGDYDDEPSEQCKSQEIITNRGDDVYDSNIGQVVLDDNDDDDSRDNAVCSDEFSNTPSFLHLTQHYSFKEQDVILAINASTRRIRLLKEKKKSEVNDDDADHENKTNSSAKDDGDILEMAMDWLSLHLNESELRHGFRVQPKPKSGVSSHDRMMANTIPMKYKAVPHDSISIMPKLTQSQYEKESREALLEWKRQQLTAELIRMGFHSLEIDSVFASLEDQMESILDKIPESNYDEGGNEVQLLSLLDDTLFAKLVECIEMEVGIESTIDDSTDVDEEIHEMATMERDQEKEVLEAIYAENFQSLNNSSSSDNQENRYLLEVNPTTPLKPPASEMCHLHVLTRRGYPLVQSPIFWLLNGGLPPSLLRRMNTSLIKKSRDQLGQASVYEMMDYLSENLSLWQQEFIDEEASAEKATADFDETAVNTEVTSDDEEIDYFTTTFTAEERKKLSRRQRQKLIAAEKLYARDEIILEKQRLKQQKDEERRQRVQLENKTVSSRMADKEVNKRWHDYVYDEAEKASRKAMNDAFLRGEGREEARVAADNARLEVLRFHGEIEENCDNEKEQSNAAGSSSTLNDDKEKVEIESDAAEGKAVNASLTTHTPMSDATPKTLLFVEKLRKMYEQKAKEKAEGIDSSESEYGTVRLANPSSASNGPTTHAPTPVVAPSPGVAEVFDDIVQTHETQPWLIAPDARVPISSEKTDFYTSETISIEELQKKEKLSKSLRADLKRKYDKRSGPFVDMLSQRAKLPAYKMRNELVKTIRKNQVTVVSGDTGCGKTTQLPQLVLDDAIQNNMGADTNIIVTQPRRISALGVADRVAAERLEKVGQTVGYSIRLDSKRSSKTRLLLCTTGVLLRRLQVDPDLASVSHVFVDEVHERDLNTDFLLIILKDLLQRRKTLKLVLMSATLNAERFSDYFSQGPIKAPIISIPGRAQPVKEYRLEDALEATGHIVLEESEYAAKKSREDNGSRLSKTALRRLYPNYGKNVITSLANVDETITNYELIGDLIEYICKLEEDGAILVFLSGLGEIKSAMEEISKREGLLDNAIIFPLHSTLSNAEQTAIFQRPPKGKRKIVLSSNIAETSITIDDVVFVIDSGRVKENRYDDLNKMPTLTETWVSKASARQRKGRAGRVKPGYCWHLYSSHTHDNVLDDYQLPEMLRVGLEDLILQILILDLGSPISFLAKAVNPPTELSVKNALQLLESLGAAEIDWDADTGDETSEASLTALGYHLAALPVHARVGKMMIYGSLFGVFDPCVTIAAAMTCRNPFVSSYDNRDAADEAKKTFAADDHLAILLAFNQWRELKRTDGRKCRAFLKEHFLSYQSLSNIVQLRNQLKRYMNDIGFLNSSSEKDMIGGNELSLIRAVISAAMYPNIIVAPKKISTTAGEVPFRGQKGEVYLHPSTIAFSAKELDSRYCCYHEIMKTSKVYVRDCTTVSILSILLFGGALKVFQSKGVVTVDEWLRFRCDAKPATLVKYLRQSMEALLLQKILDPSIDISATVKGKAVIDSVTSLLKMETK